MQILISAFESHFCVILFNVRIKNKCRKYCLFSPIFRRINKQKLFDFDKL